MTGRKSAISRAEVMEDMILRLALATILAAGTTFAIDPPQNCPNPGQQQGRGQSQMKGKRTGPRDGSGPIHTPGTGGGTGAGNRGGQRGGRR
jgi:hypothetical protein